MGLISYWITKSDKKDTLLFIHPEFTDHTYFNNQIQFFKDQTNLLLIDVIGHGQSIGKGSITETKEVILKILDFEEIDQVTAIGVGLGSYLVQDFANYNSNRIKALVSVSGFDINQVSDYQLRYMDTQNNKLIFSGFSLSNAFIKRFSRQNTYTAQAQEEVAGIVKQADKKTATKYKDIGRLWNKIRLKNRNYSLSIIIGEHDQEAIFLYNQEWVAREGQLYTIKEAGHFVNLDQPERFNECLMSLVL